MLELIEMAREVFNDYWFVFTMIGAPFVVGFGSGRLWEKFENFKDVEKAKNESSSELVQLNGILNTFLNGDVKVWDSQKGPYPGYNRSFRGFSSPIVSIANLKGGVGKTTLSLNLAAYFASIENRVLVIDLDWQGSASNVFNTKLHLGEAQSKADILISSGSSSDHLLAARRSASRMIPGLEFITAYKSLSDVENAELIAWMSGSCDFDVHYNLAKCLCNAEVMSEYDIVILDTPPRLTTALVNALCASTHVLIPTILDGASIEATSFFLRTCQRFTDDFNQHMRVAGVIGTINEKSTGPTGAEQDAIAELNDSQDALGFSGLLLDAGIPRKRGFSDVAGRDIAYLSKPAVKPFVKDLGDEVLRRLG
jgi:chromosome partitioning protein